MTQIKKNATIAPLNINNYHLNAKHWPGQLNEEGPLRAFNKIEQDLHERRQTLMALVSGKGHQINREIAVREAISQIDLTSLSIQEIHDKVTADFSKVNRQVGKTFNLSAETQTAIKEELEKVNKALTAPLVKHHFKESTENKHELKKQARKAEKIIEKDDKYNTNFPETFSIFGHKTSVKEMRQSTNIESANEDKNDTIKPG